MSAGGFDEFPFADAVEDFLAALVEADGDGIDVAVTLGVVDFVIHETLACCDPVHPNVDQP